MFLALELLDLDTEELMLRFNALDPIINIVYYISKYSILWFWASNIKRRLLGKQRWSLRNQICKIEDLEVDIRDLDTRSHPWSSLLDLFEQILEFWRLLKGLFNLVSNVFLKFQLFSIKLRFVWGIKPYIYWKYLIRLLSHHGKSFSTIHGHYK